MREIKKDILKRKRDRVKNFRIELKRSLGGCCSICEYNKCLAALEFHHNTGEKEKHVAHIIKDYSKQKTLKEIEKCILICANCHRELHNKGP